MGWNPFSIRNPIFTNHIELFLDFHSEIVEPDYIYGLKICVGKFLNFEIMFQFIKTAKNLKKVLRSTKAQKNKNEILKSSSQCSKLPNKCLKHINNSNILFHKHFLWKQLLEKMNANSKKISPKIHQSTIYYAGLLGQWDKRTVDKESDVPNIFLNIFIDLGHTKLYIFIFVTL